MRRLSLIALALVACLAVGSMTTALAGPVQTKRIKSKVTIAYHADPPAPGSYPQDNYFFGKVKARKKACRKGRRVSVKKTFTSEKIGKTLTNKKGRYRISAGFFGGTGAPAGTYRARAKKKTIVRNGKRIICKRARSKKLTLG